ncbi:hypothetical protein GOODEAATRI_009489, partial [Goodea atripinnis]
SAPQMSFKENDPPVSPLRSKEYELSVPPSGQESSCSSMLVWGPYLLSEPADIMMTLPLSLSRRNGRRETGASGTMVEKLFLIGGKP